jgi:hypothetical protein
MASINQNTTSTNTSVKRKADAFVNVIVVNKDGTKSQQLGGVPLYADNEFHAHLLNHLKNGGELNIETGVHIVEEKNASDFLL